VPPRAGVDGGVPGLHEPHQRHLPFHAVGHRSPSVRRGVARRGFAGEPNLICNISDIKLISTTVRAQAASELRDRILTGRLRPGDRLDLERLGAEFGISRTPLREALLELSYEGLVAITPRSGIAVVGITPQDAVDNFAILATLAGKAAEMATARMTAAELTELTELAGAIDRADDVVAANRRFHRAINLAARSPRLLTYLRQAVRVVPGNYFELFPEQERRSRREHAALLDAMRRGDGAAARAITEAHVLTAGEALGDWLRDIADGDGSTRGSAAGA
jgi:DNA-binding GntR family transcriptional regulator